MGFLVVLLCSSCDCWLCALFFHIVVVVDVTFSHCCYYSRYFLTLFCCLHCLFVLPLLLATCVAHVVCVAFHGFVVVFLGLSLLCCVAFLIFLFFALSLLSHCHSSCVALLTLSLFLCCFSCTALILALSFFSHYFFHIVAPFALPFFSCCFFSHCRSSSNVAPLALLLFKQCCSFCTSST